MATVVVGAGPVGLVCAVALAGAGEQVLLLDPDPGPPADGPWHRRGVMQFGHPHFLRPFVRQVLEQHAPALWDAALDAGCVVNDPPEGVPPWVTTVAARRSTFEAALHRAAVGERLTRVAATADRVLVEGGRVVGVEADGVRHDADRVVVATGRGDGLADDLRPPGERSACGQSYVSRHYRARPGVEPLRSWTPLGAQHDGYAAMVFPQDAGTLSALVVRASGDDGWTPLWDADRFDRVVAEVPVLAPWTDPERFEPITGVQRGGTLLNAYRGQGDPPAGLHWVGDAVCTTNPAAGRGVSTGLLQAGALLDLLAEHGDPRDATAAFDAWCEREVRPWYDDHVERDAALLRAYAHEELDPDGPLSTDVVVAAAEVDPALQEPVQLYAGMVAKPADLRPLLPRVRQLLRSGWRPQPSAGPTRDDLVGLLTTSCPPTDELRPRASSSS